MILSLERIMYRLIELYNNNQGTTTWEVKIRENQRKIKKETNTALKDSDTNLVDHLKADHLR